MTPKPPRGRRVLCVTAPDLPLERLWQARPQLRELPVVLYEAKGNHEVIVAASLEARAEGVAPGQTVTQARARCPALRAFPVDAEEDARALADAAEAIMAIGPTVAVEPPDALLVEVAESVHLFGGEVGAASEALALMTALGLSARAAVADGPDTAWIVARALCHAADAARVAGLERSRRTPEPPPTVQVVPPGESASTLAPLPVGLLRLGPKLDEQLQLIGVRTIGKLATLPRISVLRRFGPGGERAHRTAAGDDGHVLAPFHPREALTERSELEPPCVALDPLSFILKTLLDRLQARMTGRGVAALRLSLVLELDPVGVHVEEVSLSRPLRAAPSLLTILRERLGSVHLDAPIASAEVRVTETASFRGVQLDLLARREASAETLDELLARLTGALGKGAVFAPTLVDRYRPEGAFTPAPFDPDARRKPHDDWLPLRPLVLLPTPEPVEWQGRTLVRQKGRVPMSELHGPERLQGEWWTERFDRDYYVATTTAGARYWVFLERPAGRWFLHGVFE